MYRKRISGAICYGYSTSWNDVVRQMICATVTVFGGMRNESEYAKFIIPATRASAMSWHFLAF